MILAGLKIFVVDTWAQGYAWRVLSGGRRPPAKRDGRRGTRRAWKRRHPQGRRWRLGPVEPDHVIVRGEDVFCTARQAAAIRQAAAAHASAWIGGPKGNA